MTVVPLPICSFFLTAAFGAAATAQTGIVNGGFEDPTPFLGWQLEYGQHVSPASITWSTGGLPAGAPAPQRIESYSGTAPLNTSIQAYVGTSMAQINDLGGSNHVTRMWQDVVLQAGDVASGMLAVTWGALLQDPHHYGEPGVSIEVTDLTTTPPTPIESFSATTTLASSSWHQVQISGGQIYYRKSQLVAHLPPSLGVGQQIRVAITAWDCSGGAHGGCAFLDDVRFVDCVESPSDLVAWYRTNSLTDWSDNHHHGVWSSTWNPGSNGFVGGDGQAFQLLHHATVADDAELDFAAGTSFTFEMWLRPGASMTGGTRPLLVKTAANGAAGYGVYLQDGRPSLLLAAGTPSTTAAFHAASAIPAQVWSHVAVVVDRVATPTVTFVIDGVVDASTTAPAFAAGSLANDEALHLGSFPTGFQTVVGGTLQPVTGTFVGETDEISIYRRALGLDEVQHVYASGSRGRCPPASVSAAVSLSPWWSAWQGVQTAAIGDNQFVAVPVPGGVPFRGEIFDSLLASTNGFVFLTHGGAAGGTSPNGFGSPATMVTNLLFDAPRIAPYWCDLDLSPTNGGGLHVDDSHPDRIVLTWANATEAGIAGGKSVQCQLHRDGNIVFAYSPSCVSGPGTVLVGISPGGGSVDPGSVDLASGPARVDPTAYETFTGGSFDLAGRYVRFRPTAGGYEVLSDGVDSSGHHPYGVGCGGSVASFYETFAAGAFDLAGRSVSMVGNGGGTVVFDGAEPLVVPTTAGLGLTDDSQVTLSLPSPLWFGGLVVHDVVVCSNGYVWLAADGGNDYTPTSAELLSGTPRLAPCWCDLVPDGATNQDNVYAEFGGGSLRITWWNCRVYGTAGRLTAQLVIDYSTMDVHYVYGAGTPARPVLTGWSKGGGSIDPGGTDLSHDLPFAITDDDVAGLVLSAVGAPMPGSALTFTASNVPPGAALTMHFLGFVATAALDLGLLGAPGCHLLVDLPVVETALMIGSPSATRILTLPNSVAVAGLGFYSQCAAIVPGANALGLWTSNAVLTAVAPF